MRHSISVALLSTVLVCCATAVDAQDSLTQAVASCAILAGDLERLACYDEAAKAAGIAGPQAVAPAVDGVGAWRVRRERNPIDDSETVTLALTATEGTSRWGDPVTFIARCRSNTTEAYIVWGDYLGDDSNDVYSDWKHVMIRVGNEPAEQERWPVSTDGKATFAPGWAGTLLARMAAADKFLAQTTPYSENPTTAIFATSGLRQALKPLLEVCGWSLEG